MYSITAKQKRKREGMKTMRVSSIILVAYCIEKSYRKKLISRL